ncbi:protein translocase subunit SecD [Candidatus Contendibacter odensensis]|uniref:Protein translocase subunit SecD n=1 Tax=Candidatus Contendobacter odensis Run_B_J11 TaxID=1400861 RepID=A0A7U7GCT7_9GAMM|nr:protein translocase subunit SecD [Candidatus Contendobacter odensis]CDH46044.1 preprotein translocase, auxillary membrane component (General Secretory Pathway) [Candidatus Contendobacter odensis Run_B_J11]
MSTPYTLNQYPLWKYLLISLVMLWGLIFALPNLFGEDPAVQISGARANIVVDSAFQNRVAALLDAEKLPIKRLELQEGRLLVRFADPETQLKAADILKDQLGRDYIVALNLASAAPGFMRALGLNPMYLGLDLRGGVHFLMQVDMDATIKQIEDSYVDEVRAQLRSEKVLYTSVGRVATGGVQVEFKDAAERDKAAPALRKNLSGLQQSQPGPLSLKLTLGEREIKEKRDFALQQNITTLRNRVNELGVAEPIIQQQGSDRIVVQLPGVQDTARAKEILGATATLEFRLADEENDWNQAATSGHVPLNSRLYKDRNGRPVLLQKRVMLTGDAIVDASSGLDPQNGGATVYVTLDGKGAKRFEDATKDNIGKRMGVVFIENKTETKRVNGDLKKTAFTVEEVINVATIRDRLSRRFQITGLESTREARDLALLLRAGALVSPIEIIEERTVGPSAGKENIAQGFRAAFISFLVIGAFMVLRYKRFGMIANAALAANVVLIIAALSTLQATLSLPGIAGIVLTMGMAVDANVLIYERIREELRNGTTPQAAIHAGFDRAFDTILDSNITTLIAAIMLFGFGSGPIKGFAVTLSIGILTSMFTAVTGSRALVNLIYGGRKLTTLSV